MAQMGVLWTAAWYDQEVAWHECMGREAVVGLRGGDPVEELLECMAHLSDQVGRKPSGAMCSGWYRQLVADEWRPRRLSGLRQCGNTCLWW